jgi:hypothetical protein
MITVERNIQKIRPGKWAELEELDKKFNAAERRLGFPPNKKRYRCVVGGHDMNTLVIEYQWDSLAAMEAVYEKALADPEYQALMAETEGIVESDQMELYEPLP